MGKKNSLKSLKGNVEELAREESAISQLVEAKPKQQKLRMTLNLSSFLSDDDTKTSSDQLWRSLNSTIVYLDPIDEDIQESP